MTRAGSIVVLGAAMLITTLAAATLSSQTEQVVPVHEEPRHRLVFERPGIRVLDIQIPPGDTTLFHTHSDPILYVTMSTSRTRSQNLGAEWGGSPAVAPSGAEAGKPGVVPSTPPGRLMSTTSYGEKPLTHRVNNIGDSLFRLIGITNASQGDPNTTASPDFDEKPELDNRWFRGYRWSLAQTATPEHVHRNPVVVVLVAGRAQANGGQAASHQLEEAGAFAYFDQKSPHILQGLTADAELMEIEIRRPADRP